MLLGNKKSNYVVGLDGYSHDVESHAILNFLPHFENARETKEGSQNDRILNKESKED